MAEVKPMMISVEALKYHTNAGKEYQVGDTYSVEDSAVASLATQGMAVRVDRVAYAKALAPSKSGKLKPVKAGKKAKGKGKK